MTASGVCHSDLHVRDGEWPRPGPIVMGHEGAGVIEAVGVPGMQPWVVGRQAVLSWYAPCLACRECQRGRQWLCRTSPSLNHAMADGTTRTTRADGTPVLTYCGIGTMASYQVVPVTSVVPMPEGVPHEVAALIGCGVSTGVGAVIKTAAVPPAATVADHRPRRRRPVVRHGRRHRERLADRRRRHEPGQARARPRARRDRDACSRIRPTRPARSRRSRTRPATAGRTSRSRRSGCPRRWRRRSSACRPAAPRSSSACRRSANACRSRASRSSTGRAGSSAPTTGRRSPAVDFPQYAQWYLEGKLPIDRLIDRRLPLADLDDAFDRLRAGQAARQVVVFEDAASG